jgi:hypothetical protein
MFNSFFLVDWIMKTIFVDNIFLKLKFKINLIGIRKFIIP